MLVTVADLTKYMDIRFSNRQEEAAEFVLEGLQSELESYLRRPVEPTEFIEDYFIDSEMVGVPSSLFFYDSSLDTTQSPSTQIAAYAPVTLHFRNSPVVEIDSITVKNRYNDEIATLSEGTDYLARRWGVDLFTVSQYDTVTVTYTAGLNGNAIKVFKLLILRAATREMQNMHDDVVGVKDLETRNVAPLETGFLEKELLSVKKWKRVRVA